jgi:hypothetical protein
MSKQIRFVSGLAIDDKPLCIAVGAWHHAPPRAAAIVATTCNGIYGIYASQGSKQIRSVSGLAIDDEPFANAAGAPPARGCGGRDNDAMTSMESMDLKATKNASIPIRYS